VGPVIAARGSRAPRWPPGRLRDVSAAGLTRARSNEAQFQRRFYRRAGINRRETVDLVDP
jgi:hypothetical protein